MNRQMKMRTQAPTTVADCKRLIENAKKVLITTHVSPDGDAAGASLALQRALQSMGKQVSVVFSDALSSAYDFLPGTYRLTAEVSADLDADLVIVLDVGDPSRVGFNLDQLSQRGVPTINIDHHITNVNFATANLVDPSSVATCELVFELLMELAVEIDREIATCLLTGIVTDTQGFRVPATSARTFRIAAELVDRGASIGDISDQVFKTKPASSLKLWGLSLGRIQQRGAIIFTELLTSMHEESGAGMEESEGLVNLLASVRNADVAILFKQAEENVTRVSVRTTSRVNAASVCGYFGGGGHARAAGCNFALPLGEAKAVFLAHVEDVLRGS